MDLSALWNVKRLASQRNFISSELAPLMSDCDIVPTASRNRTKTSIVTPSLTVKPPKKKSSTSSAANSMRDQVFQLMVDTSIAPLSTETSLSASAAMSSLWNTQTELFVALSLNQLTTTESYLTSSDQQQRRLFLKLSRPDCAKPVDPCEYTLLHAPSPSPGAVKTVAEIVNDMEDKTIRTACAITLCNLCSLQGEEGLLVEDGAVSALSTLINEHEKVSHICRCALFNLTCVSQSYHKIESVLKAFIALTSTRNSSGNAAERRKEYDDITPKLCVIFPTSSESACV
ncbi:Armadillo-type fold [Phytophthora cactorum]|nr:Armadillo-type fold [Phytophthora cactorum]